MRILKLCAVLGVLAALVVPAGAIVVPSIPNGNLFWTMTNRDMGAGYYLPERTGVAGTYTRGTDGVWRNASGGDAVALGQLGVSLSPGRMNDNEDTWGVWAIDQLRPGVKKTYFDPATGTEVEGMGSVGLTKYYQWTDTSTTGLVGMFYGGQDTSVTIAADGKFTINTDHVNFDLYAVDTSLLKDKVADTPPTIDFEGPFYETGRRSGTNGELYAGWIDPTDTTKILLLHGESVFFQFSGSFPGGTHFVGDGLAYYEIDSGLTNPIWNQYWGSIPSDALGTFTTPTGLAADAWTSTGVTTDDKDWRGKTIDNGGASVVPEPVTMLGLLLGIGGIGRYLRRRIPA